MNDKEKQIEEMARLLNKANGLDDTPAWYADFIPDAEALYNAGYRKIPENRVVFDRDDWMRWVEDIAKQTRKETARDIVRALKKKLYTNNYCQEIVTEEMIDEIAKQFGVEIEE